MEHNTLGTGEIDERITDDPILEILDKSDSAIKPHSAQQIADKLECTQQTVERKLRDLETRDAVLKHDQDAQTAKWTPRRMRR